MIEVLHYVTEAGVDLFAEWLEGLRDKRAAARIAIRIDRLSQGNFGDVKALGSGISELRIDAGPGYRVYFGSVNKQMRSVIVRWRQATASSGHSPGCSLLG